MVDYRTKYNDLMAFVEQTLKDRIFIGNYMEKRYVNKINQYRDLIALNRNEKILCDDLSELKNRILNCNLNHWIGYTDSNDIVVPNAYCIWTILDETENITITTPIVFGEYWFQIKSLQFSNNSIEISLKVLRPIDATSTIASTSTYTSTHNTIEENSTRIQRYVQENIIDVDWHLLFNQWKTAINQTTYRFLSTEINRENIFHCLRLFGVLFIAGVSSFIYFIKYLGEFTLKLMVELEKLLHTLLPIILALINLVGKIIGGLYILLAMMWRDLFGRKDDNTGANQSSQSNNFGGYSRPSIGFRDYQRIVPSAQNTYSSRRPRYSNF